MRSTSRRNDAAKADIDRIIRNALGLVADRDDSTKAAFGRLLRQVRHRSDLLRPPRAGGRYDPMFHTNVLVGLLSLASFHPQWLRPIDAWKPVGENLLPQFSTLARHLLAAFGSPQAVFDAPVAARAAARPRTAAGAAGGSWNGDGQARAFAARFCRSNSARRRAISSGASFSIEE